MNLEQFFSGIPQKTYRVGDRFWSKHSGSELILAHISSNPNCVNLIELKSGQRWGDHILVSDTSRISQTEINQLLYCDTLHTKNGLTLYQEVCEPRKLKVGMKLKHDGNEYLIVNTPHGTLLSNLSNKCTSYWSSKYMTACSYEISKCEFQKILFPSKLSDWEVVD